MIDATLERDLVRTLGLSVVDATAVAHDWPDVREIVDIQREINDNLHQARRALEVSERLRG